MTNDSIKELLSDSGLAGKLNNLLSQVGKTSQNNVHVQEDLNEKQKLYRKYIDIIQTLMPIIPDKNRVRAELIVKILEGAVIIQSFNSKS